MELKALLFVSLLLLTSLFADTSSTDAEFHGEAKAKITFLEKQNIELKTKLDGLEDKQKSVEEYKNIIDRQDKRVEDVNTKMASVSEKTSWLAIIIGCLTFLIGLGGIIFPYVMYKQNKKSQEEAKEDIKLWKEITKKEFDLELKSFKEHSISVQKELDDTIELLKDEAKQSIEDIRKNMIKNQVAPIQKHSENFALDKLAETLQKKPMVDYTFDDWNSLAFDAYGKGKNENAVFYWTKAIELGNPTEINIAETLIQKGHSLSEIKDYNKALEVFNEVLHRFNKDSNNEVMQEQIAIALLNKGFILGLMNDSNDAMETYNELIKRFKDSRNQIIQEQVAQALVNLFECLLILNLQELDNEKVKLFMQCAKDDKDLLLQFKMLQTVKNALQEDQTLLVEQLKDEFSDNGFEDWSWEELNTWVKKLEDTEAKLRVQETIEAFQNWDMK